MSPARKKSKSHRSDGAHRPKFPAPNESSDPPAREGLTYAEAQKMVEIDVGGRIQRINICDNLEIMSKDEYEKYIAAGMTDGMRMDSSLKIPCLGSNRESMTSIGSISSIMVGASKLSSVGDDRGGKLPEPSFRCIENYDIPDAPEKPNSYIRFIERSPDELDAEVEYDMDEEDVAWLNIINGQREANSLPPVSMETFELLMDRFEKESYFEVQTNGKDGSTVIDDDAVCCICMDGECQNSNVILFCDMCNLAVHQDCYGVPYIPEGQWWCRRCLQSPSRAVDCVLCPNNGGAFKQTDQGHWAHVVCALWIPEVRFANTVFLEPIDSIETIPPARWKLTCYICKQRGVGACIQCHKTNCYAAFHVTCAQQAGLYMKMDTVRETNGVPSGTPGESAVLIQKTAFCDLHTPPDSESRPRVREKGDAKEESRQKMKKARKILAQKRSSIPVISIPTIPPERIIEIAMLVDMPQRNYFIQRLISYWTLKRQNRNGVPLLRRLQATHQARPDERPVGEKIASKSELCQQLKYWQCLRQDLERARLLCELVRKREKLKKEFVKVKEKTLELELHPLVCFLRRVLEMIKSRDAGEIFSEPVDPGEVPDYGDVVKNPMDLSTMRQKLENFHYKDLDEFEADFSLMLHNCMAYNPKETVFYRAAVKMRDQGGAIIRQARRDFDSIGFDVESGTMLPERPRVNGQPADEKIVEEVDQILNSDDRKNLSPQDHLNKLLELLEKSQKLQHAILRAKRTRIIKKEITKLRRRLAFERSGSLPGRKVSATASKESPVLSIRGRRRTLSKNSSTPVTAEKNSKSSRWKSIDASPDVQMKSEDGFESDSEAECSSGGEAAQPAAAAVGSEEGEEDKKASPTPKRRSRKSAKEEPAQENVMAEKEMHKKSSTPSAASNTPYQTRKSALKQQTAEPTVVEVNPVEKVSRRQSMRHQSESVPSPLIPRSRRGVSIETKVTRSSRDVKEPVVKTPVSKPGKGSKGTSAAHAKTSTTPTKAAVPPEEPPVLVPAVDNEDNDETDTPKRGRRKKIPKRQWGDDVSSAQAEPAAAKISPIQRRSSSQQQSLSSQGPSPEPRKSPLRLRQATPDASQGKPASSQSMQTHPKVGIGAAAKSLGSGGKPSSVAVKMAATPSAKPPGQSSSKPLGAAITSLPVTPLSSPLLSTPTKSDSQALPLAQSNQQQQVSSGGSTGSPSGVNRRTAVLFTRKAAAAAFRKPDTPTPAAPKRRVGRPRKNLDAALGTVASPPASSSPLMLPGTSSLAVIGDPQSHLKGPLNSTSAAHLGQTDPSSPIVPATESFRVYRSGGDIPAETDDDSQSDSSSSSCSSSGSSSGSEGGGSSEDEDDEGGHPAHSESSGDEGGGGGDEMGGNAGTSTSGHRHQAGQQLSCGVVPLKPLDLVWAKCRGYPWYPALIIDPKMPKTGILHNGVPIPAAPADVLALSLNYTEPVFLVLFFDTKRTWQWLPRNKLEPLGMSTELDDSKLTESRKPTERKAVRKAFQEAMQYQCQVTGQSGETPLSSQVSLQPLNTSVSVTHSLSSTNPGQSSIAF